MKQLSFQYICGIVDKTHLLELYEATFNVTYLTEAVQLSNIMVEEFWDITNGPPASTTKNKSPPDMHGAALRRPLEHSHSALTLITWCSRAFGWCFNAVACSK